MEPLMFVMAILGCGESDAPCREVQIVETRYANEADCLAETEAQLMRQSALPYPNVVAQCRREGSAAQMLRGSDVMMPEPELQPGHAPRYADARDTRRR